MENHFKDIEEFKQKLRQHKIDNNDKDSFLKLFNEYDARTR